ncbi:hypothetical protein Gogos_004582 [Gossypium gossypioides]|uniref:Uncharacterized protein n=1 Tax=Gossypium gossypioides TaxID=34282 RepID=A0A7J9CGP0_GOSGO|nr:hypothetical protein [Gossypium gossypioides]
MSTETKANSVKMKPSGQDGSSKGKFDAAMNKRKLESSSKQPVGAKQKSATTKAEVKSKTSSSSSKTSTTTKAKVREKKVYTLPGQKHDPPEEHLFDVLQAAQFDLRASSVEVPFFLCDASLFFGHYDNYCLMWFHRMMEHGLLSPEKDRKAYEKKQRRQKQLRTGTLIKILETEWQTREFTEAAAGHEEWRCKSQEKNQQ